MNVTLVDKMGNDLSVVNAARVSFGKKKEKFDDKDKKLIGYLARHNHWTPFGHVSLQFHIVAPVFVARQLVKHQVGLVWNEISRRYVDSDPEYYTPEKWRLKASNKKQGSSDEFYYNEVVTKDAFDPSIPSPGGNPYEMPSYKYICEQARIAYNSMINIGICPEQARRILPQSMMTAWYWTRPLMAFARVCNLRCKPDTQLETQWIADKIDKLAVEVAPVSWEQLRK